MTAPVVQDNEGDPTGARITLSFSKFVPDVTSSDRTQQRILFRRGSPVQAYTDTFTTLKAAILNHHVLVGMSTDMVLFRPSVRQSRSP